MNSKQWIVLTGACIITVVLRIGELPLWNFGSMAALALFCGSVVRAPYAVFLPLAVRVLTDLLIHVKTGYGFFPSWPFDYVAYVVIFFLVGRFTSPGRAGYVVAGSLAASVIYFAISNFGHWWMTADYPATAQGLIQCYEMGLPFAKGTLFGNVVFAPLFFLAWNLCASESTVGSSSVAAAKAAGE